MDKTYSYFVRQTSINVYTFSENTDLIYLANTNGTKYTKKSTTTI